jgi:uncharacterized protein YndB with AHSA1/START domain
MPANNSEVSKDLVITRSFDVSVERVWKAWSESTDLLQWWGPKNFICPVAKMDFRVGGTSLLCMRAPKDFGGQDFYNSWTYTKILPLDSIEFVMHFCDELGNKVNPKDLGLPPELAGGVRQTIVFRSINERTEITITEFGYTDPKTFDLSKRGMEECLDKMELIFQKET